MTDDLVAQFLARGGEVTRIDSGERSLSEREIWLARRGETQETSDNDLIAERHVRGDLVYNGLGELIGYA